MSWLTAKWKRNIIPCQNVIIYRFNCFPRCNDPTFSSISLTINVIDTDCFNWEFLPFDDLIDIREQGRNLSPRERFITAKRLNGHWHISFFSSFTSTLFFYISYVLCLFRRVLFRVSIFAVSPMVASATTSTSSSFLTWFNPIVIHNL